MIDRLADRDTAVPTASASLGDRRDGRGIPPKYSTRRLHLAARAATKRARPRGPIGFLFVFLPLLLGNHSPGKDLLFVGVQFDKVAVIDCIRDVVETEIQLRHKVPMDMAASRDGHWLFVVTNQKETIEIIDVAARKVIESIELSQGGCRVKVFGLVPNLDGETIFLHVKMVQERLDEYAVEPPQIAALDLKTKQMRTLAEVPEGINRLAISADGRLLYALGREALTIQAASGKIVKRTPLFTRLPDGSIVSDIFNTYGSEDQSGIYSAPYYAETGGQSSFGVFTVDTVSKRVELRKIGSAIPLFSTIVAPGGRYAYGVLHDVVKIDLQQRQVVKTVPLDRVHYMLGITSSGRKLYLGGAGPEMDVFDAASLKFIRAIPLSGDMADASMRLIVAR